MTFWQISFSCYLVYSMLKVNNQQSKNVSPEIWLETLSLCWHTETHNKMALVIWDYDTTSQYSFVLDMSFVGCFEFQQGGVKRLGIFSSCGGDVDSFWVQICERTDHPLKLLGAQHNVYVDRRRSLKLSVIETAERRPVYIVNRRFFALEGGCRVTFRADVYGISKEWLRRNDQLSDLAGEDFPPSDYWRLECYSKDSFLGDMFYKYQQREVLAASFQLALRNSRGIYKVNFTVQLIRPDTWEHLFSLLGGDIRVQKKNGTRTQDIETDEFVSKVSCRIRQRRDEPISIPRKYRKCGYGEAA